MSMLELFPTGTFDIKKITKKGIYFEYQGSLISIPRSLIAMNSCVNCIHFDFDNKDSNVCNAFKNGIPDEIFLGKNDHKKPYPGDKGIRFKPIVK